MFLTVQQLNADLALRYVVRRTDSIGLIVNSTVYLGVAQVSCCGLRILLYAICSYIDAISEQLNLKKRLRKDML